MNILKQSHGGRTDTGVAEIKLELAEQQGAKLAYITFGVNYTNVDAVTKFTCALSKAHVSTARTPLTAGEIYYDETNLVHFGGLNSLSTSTGALHQPLHYRVNLIPFNYVFVTNPSIILFTSEADLEVNIILGYDVVRVSRENVAEIYQYQGGIE